MKNPKLGQVVIIYDRYRFAIPLRAVVEELTEANDGVRLRLLESNNDTYPVGSRDVWVSRRQIRKTPKDEGK